VCVGQLPVSTNPKNENGAANSFFAFMNGARLDTQKTYYLSLTKGRFVMKYDQIIKLRNGKIVFLRSAKGADAKGVIDIFNLTHKESDFLYTYPEENYLTVEEETDFLNKSYESDNSIEIIAIIDGKVVGSGGISPIDNKFKVRHRAEFGIAVQKQLWGCGIGGAILAGCIECAKKAGYEQLELSVVAENVRALTMYRSRGFVEIGRNPKGYKTKYGTYQELILMKLDLK